MPILQLYKQVYEQLPTIFACLIWVLPRKNLSSGFPSKKDINQPAEHPGLARILKFCTFGKACEKRPLKNRPNKDLNDKW